MYIANSSIPYSKWKTVRILGISLRASSPIWASEADAQSEKKTRLFKYVQNLPPQTDGMIRFSFNIGCSESKVIFK